MRGSQASIIETERLKNHVKELQAKIEEQVRTIERLKRQIEQQQPKQAVTITEL